MSKLILREATEANQVECWSQNSEEWGKPIFTRAQYIAREQQLSKSNFSQTRTTWMLCRESEPDTVLCSCETYKRPVVFVRGEDVKEGVCDSIASVFTSVVNRGNGYATKMITLLGEKMDRDGEVVCSNLFSDIGPIFYANMGWRVYEHLQGEILATLENCELLGGVDGKVEFVTEASLDELIAKTTKTTIKNMKVSDEKTLITVLPTKNNILWIHARADLYAECLGKPSPKKWGVSHGEDFLLWTHDFKENVLLVTRVCVKDEATTRQLLGYAVKEACDCGFVKVVVWNPQYEVDVMAIVERESSISSMRLFGELKDQQVKWHANEKFGWV